MTTVHLFTRIGVYKSKLIEPVKLRVIQVVFAGEVVFVLPPHFLAGKSSGDG